MITKTQAIITLATIVAKEALKENLCNLDDSMTKAEKREELNLSCEDAFYGQLDDMSAEIDRVAQKIYKSLVRKELSK